jgi:predicted RNA methylase
MSRAAPRHATAFVSEVRITGGRMKFVCDLRGDHARQVCYMGYLEPQESVIVRQLLQPGQVFLDLGAHWGYFTLVAADRVGPGGKVVACEPHSELYRLLEANIALNGLQMSVTALAVAVAATDGEMELTGFPPGSRSRLRAVC